LTTEIQILQAPRQAPRHRSLGHLSPRHLLSSSVPLAIPRGVVLLLGMLACTQVSDEPAVLVEVGDFTVSQADLRDYEARLPEHLQSVHTGEAQIRDVLGGLVDRQIMVIEAEKLGYFEIAAVQRRLHGHAVEWLTRRLLDSVIGDSVHTAAEEEQAYRKGWNRRVRLAHIELSDEVSAIAAAQLLAAGANFAEVARSRSRATDAAAGGDLVRYFSLGDLPPALAAGIEHIEVGDVSGIIPTNRGFEIVKVVASDTVTFEEVREPLRRRLQQHAARVARDQLLIGLETRFALSYDGSAIVQVQEHAAHEDGSLVPLQADQPLVVRKADMVLLWVGDGIRLLRSGALGRDATVDSSSFVTALRTRILADSLLVWEARRRGLNQDPVFARFHQRRLEKLAVTHLRKKQVIERIVITDEELRQRYEQDIEEYSEQPITEITEIFTDSLRLARQLRRRVLAGEDMVELARRYSTQRTSHGHRHMSEFPGADEDADRAQIREAVDERDVGSLIGPIELRAGGFAIVRLEGRTGPQPRPFEAVRPVLEYKLKREKNAAEFERYIEGLRLAYSGDVVWHDESIAALVQERAALQ
jgi:parvulin-like peptidyl-prolyl isomerase